MIKINIDGNEREDFFSRSFFRLFIGAFFCACLMSVFFMNANAQTKKNNPKSVTPKNQTANLPKVTQINELELKNLLKPNGKPLLINFWATWCIPCREEFPDLVKIGADYKDKIDLITISLDELSEINGDVPKFLAEMKAEMPAYLLKTGNEEAAIAEVSKEWQGGLPFSVLYNSSGEKTYTMMGKFKPETLRAKIDENLAAPAQITELPKSVFYADLNYEKGIVDAKKDVAAGRLIIKSYGFAPASDVSQLRQKYGIEFNDYGCLVSGNLIEYVRGYNEISKAEIKRKFGDEWHTASNGK